MKGWRTHKYVFESDAKLLVDAFHGNRGSSFFDRIVEYCVELFKHFEEVLFVFFHRSANNIVAHLLAQAEYSMSGPQEWCYTAPNFIACNLAL